MTLLTPVKLMTEEELHDVAWYIPRYYYSLDKAGIKSQLTVYDKTDHSLNRKRDMVRAFNSKHLEQWFLNWWDFYNPHYENTIESGSEDIINFDTSITTITFTYKS